MTNCCRGDSLSSLATAVQQDEFEIGRHIVFLKRCIAAGLIHFSVLDHFRDDLPEHEVDLMLYLESELGLTRKACCGMSVFTL